MTKVVVADDEPDVLESTAMVLQMNGFEVVPVGSASKILATILQVRPDVLLQDVFMPGLELAAHIAEIRARPELRGLRILIFTASTEAEDITRRLGADGYIRKPFEAARIRQILTRLMATPAGGTR